MNALTEKIRRGFPDKRVLVVGDLVADQFLRGTIDRVSREAPVFILRHDETETIPGAAANAAANVASLGGRAVLVGAVGGDPNGAALLAALDSAGIDRERVVVSEKLRTTTKVRVLAGQHYAPRQQVIRIDYEDRGGLAEGLAGELLANVREAAAGADAIIISDYGYGVAGRRVFEVLKRTAAERGIPLVVDSRSRLRDFPGATSATPNQEEAEQMLGRDFRTEDASLLREELGLGALLVTLGNKGMVLAEKGLEPVRLGIVGSDQPVDVTGAGDTVIAAYVLGLAAGLGFADAARVANHAGGLVVMKRGTAAAGLPELLGSLGETGRPAPPTPTQG